MNFVGEINFLGGQLWPHSFSLICLLSLVWAKGQIRPHSFSFTSVPVGFVSWICHGR